MRGIMKPDRRSLLTAAAASAPALWLGAAFAADPDAPDAAETLARERALAAAENKGVLIEFFASWCVWCQPMDRLLHDPALTEILAPRFRILRVRVLERRGVERARQLAGANDLFVQYGLAGAGLPFLTFLNGEGRTLITSVCAQTNENIGFPVDPHELDWFENMLAAAAPESTPAQRHAARAACARLHRR